MKPEDFHVEGPPRVGVLEALREQLAKDADKEQPEFVNGDRRTLLSFIADVYQPYENGFTRQVLELLVEYNVPFQVLTKGGLRATRDFDLYDNDRGWFGTTMCFSNELNRPVWEPSAASVYDRALAIWEARAHGIYTWVSIEPVIKPYQALQVISWLTDKVDEFRVSKLNHVDRINTDEETKTRLKQIDWAAFALDALATLQESGCDWMIKDDLYAYLPPGSPQSSAQ